MSRTDPYVVAIVPARSGSKGIKDKNLRTLGSSPLIAWSVTSGLKSKSISRTIVSTNSKEYARIATDWGAEVPFLRPESISQDNSTDIELIIHALDFFKKEGKIPDLLVHLRPTTPLRNSLVIDQAVAKTKERAGEITSTRSVHEMSETAYKSFEIGKKGNLVSTFSHSEALDASNLPRQSFPQTYFPNGYVDVLIPEYILSMGVLHGNYVMPFITEPAIEVDTEFDLDILRASIAINPQVETNLFGEL